MKSVIGQSMGGRIILDMEKFFALCKSMDGKFEVTISTVEEAITMRQVRTYWHLVGQASEQTGYTKFDIDVEWRAKYGKEFFQTKETKLRDGRILLEHSSLTSISVKDMNTYIQNIIHGSIDDGLIMQEPDFMKRKVY